MTGVVVGLIATAGEACLTTEVFGVIIADLGVLVACGVGAPIVICLLSGMVMLVA